MKTSILIGCIVLISIMTLVVVVNRQRAIGVLEEQVNLMEGAYNSFVPIPPGYYRIKNDSLFCYMDKSFKRYIFSWSLLDVYTLDYDKLRNAYSVEEK